jgi:5-hydroxyisourate hydrolase-like protein (transthyretin family)
MSAIRQFIAITIMLSCGAVITANAQVKPPLKQVNSGVITGTVTIKGKPAQGITIILRSSTNYSSFEPVSRARTDQEGRYRLTELPPGGYQAMPVAPGFVPASFNASRGEVIVLSEGESVEGIDFALVRGGVITGKVVDTNGKPLIEQRVNLVSAERTTTTQPVVIQTSNSMTDDRGVYRMFGLTAGRYNVFVGQADDNFFNAVSGRANYKQTFHPGVTEESEATVVEVGEGTEATNVDITVGPPPQTFAASGRIVDGETGKPVANVRLALQMISGDQRSSFMGTMAVSNFKGEFRIENLSSGKYGVFTLPGPNSEVRADGVRIDVVDRDVEGLLIKTVKGASVAGRVVIENPVDRAVLEKLSKLYLQVFVQSSGVGGGFVQTATISPDGSFRVGGLQGGTVNISLSAQDRSLLNGFSIVRIMKDDMVQPRGLAINAGDQITGVQVIVTYGNAIVRGSVKFLNGTPPPGSRIFLRVSKPGEPLVRGPAIQVDARGHFMIEGLVTGTYDVLVTVASAGSVGATSSKHQISVTDGVETEVTLTVDLGSRPGPQQ